MQKLFQLAVARSALSELRLNLSEEFCNRVEEDALGLHQKNELERRARSAAKYLEYFHADFNT